MTCVNLLREEPGLSGLGLNRLSEWLDDGVDSHGETYREMRRRLVSYFDRHNRLSADELADETLSRIAMALENGAIAVTPPGRFCYVVARSVLLEDFHRDNHAVECLEGRLQKLQQGERELIVEYYRDAGGQKIERRRELAKRLGISMNALGIRATCIRDALEVCVGPVSTMTGSGSP